MTRPAPLLGQRSRAVLDPLAHSGAEIDALQRAGGVVLGRLLGD